MADSNVTEKPLLEKIRDLLERKQENYVGFCVGKEKKMVRALKLILKASSPFLEKEFEEKWEVAVIKEGDGIPLPDFDPIAFELFVKLTSLDTWSLESLKALNLQLNQILNLLSICRRFEKKIAVGNLEQLATTFLQSFGEYKDTDDFLQLSQTNLKSVLGSDDIKIKELDVFYAAIRWADFQCRQMEVLPTEEQLREVLGNCLFEIRFPLMTCAEFTEARGSKDILTGEESLGVYGFIGLTGNKNRKRLKLDSKMLPLKTTPRMKVQTSESNQNSETYNRETLNAPGTSRLHLTRGLGSAQSSPIVCDDIGKTQLRPHTLESTSSPQLPAAPLSKTSRWGNEINGFPRRGKHAAVAVGNAIYSFGGDGHYDPRYYSRGVLDVFVLNVNEVEKKWKKLSVKNSNVKPNQRENHSAMAHKEFVFIFGGFDTKKVQESNSTYRLNTQTLKWDKPKVTGNVPAARRSHSAVVLRNKMFIYGGIGKGVTNDLHSLDLESFRWSSIETKGIPPSICWNHSAAVHNDRFILIFGGFDRKKTETVNTIHSFDVNNKTWTTVAARGTPPPSRMRHCAFVHNGRMYIFGGSYYEAEAEFAKYFNDVFSFDAETFEWKEVTTNGKAPSPRCSAGCVALNDQVFIFGGAEGVVDYLDDTNVLQM